MHRLIWLLVLPVLPVLISACATNAGGKDTKTAQALQMRIKVEDDSAREAAPPGMDDNTPRDDKPNPEPPLRFDPDAPRYEPKGDLTLKPRTTLT